MGWILISFFTILYWPWIGRLRSSRMTMVYGISDFRIRRLRSIVSRCCRLFHWQMTTFPSFFRIFPIIFCTFLTLFQWHWYCGWMASPDWCFSQFSCHSTWWSCQTSVYSSSSLSVPLCIFIESRLFLLVLIVIFIDYGSSKPKIYFIF